MRLLDLLGDVAWAMCHFGAITTGRTLPRRDMIRARNKGLVESVGQVTMCSADGFRVEPERWREGWRLTRDGRVMLREGNPLCASMYLGRGMDAETETGKDGAE
jgi:hypothetical protein